MSDEKAGTVVVEIKAISTQMDAKLESLHTLLLEIRDALDAYAVRARAFDQDEPDVDVRGEAVAPHLPLRENSDDLTEWQPTEFGQEKDA